MKIPSYENQVSAGQINAAQPKQGQPLTAAFGGELGRGAANFAQGVNHLAVAADRSAERLETRQRTLRTTSAQLNWQKENDEILHGKIGPDGKRISGGLLTKEYNDAEGIAQEYYGKKDELMKKYLAAAATPEEYEELSLYFEKDFQNNFDRVAQHQLKQQRATTHLVTDAFTTGALKQIAETPEELEKHLSDITEKNNETWKGDGLPEAVRQANLYAINGQAVSAAVGTYLERGQTQQAADAFNKYREKLDTKTATTLAKQIKTAAVNDMKNDLWETASKVRTATGEVNLEYARRVVAATGYDRDIQDDLLKDLEARMADEKRIKEQRERASNETFYAQADNLVNGDGTLEQGLKLAAQYATDSKDKFTKEKFMRSLFEEKNNSGRATKSDPEEYVRLWKGIQNGTATEDDVRASFDGGLLNATDYRGLVKDCYSSGEEKQAKDFALKQIEANAKKKIADTADRAIFMIEVQRQAKGKTPEEMVSIANSLLQKSGGVFSDYNYEAGYERNMEQQRVVGDYMRAYPDGGQYVNLIISAVKQGKKDPNFAWGEDDLEKWTKQYGDKKLFTDGTPENKALNYMLENHVVPTDEDMEYMINHFYEAQGQKSPKALRQAAESERSVRSAAKALEQHKLAVQIMSLGTQEYEQEII